MGSIKSTKYRGAGYVYIAGKKKVRSRAKVRYVITLKGSSKKIQGPVVLAVSEKITLTEAVRRVAIILKAMKAKKSAVDRHYRSPVRKVFEI